MLRSRRCSEGVDVSGVVVAFGEVYCKALLGLVVVALSEEIMEILAHLLSARMDYQLARSPRESDVGSI